MRPRFEDNFKTDTPRRDNFLARLFGLFNEEIVRAWGEDERALYQDLGRPTLWPRDSRSYHTLDFTLRHRGTGATYAAELKCELAWANYSYLRLTHPTQLDHHTGAAFQAFLSFAREPARYEVRVAARSVPVDGAILIWGAITDEGTSSVIEQCGFAGVLSIEQMLDDLAEWGSPQWEDRVAELRRWTDYLLSYLAKPTA